MIFSTLSLLIIDSTFNEHEILAIFCEFDPKVHNVLDVIGELDYEEAASLVAVKRKEALEAKS